MPTTITIDDAVKTAIKDGAGSIVLGADGNPLKNEDGEQVVLKDKTGGGAAETTDEDTSDDTSEVDKKTAEALRLWEALSDPKLARSIIKEMAETAGMEVTTRKEVVAATKDVLEVLKENLPEEQKFLADTMGPAIKKMIEEMVEQRTAPLLARAEEAQLVQVKNEIDGAFNSLAKKYPEIRKHEEAMNKLADKFALTPGTPLEEYIEGLYQMATVEKKTATTLEKTVNKINRNAAKSLPASAQVDDTTVQRGSKLPTLKEAIDAAKKGISLR